MAMILIQDTKINLNLCINQSGCFCWSLICTQSSYMSPYPVASSPPPELLFWYSDVIALLFLFPVATFHTMLSTSDCYPSQETRPYYNSAVQSAASYESLSCLSLFLNKSTQKQSCSGPQLHFLTPLLNALRGLGRRHLDCDLAVSYKQCPPCSRFRWFG